jgi:BioD-like phosphotransacetylase family protein
MQPLYISATRQDTGKTTLILGLVQTLRDLGHNVGYMKPVGQRYVVFEGMNVDEDAVLARAAFDLSDHAGDLSPVAVEHGFTEQYIFNRNPAPLEERIRSAYGRLLQAHPRMVIEGTGHAGVGSCFDLSNARVAELLGAAVVIVADGGIGRAIDEVALSLHAFNRQGVRVLGVILNKVWDEKRDKIEKAVAQGLKNLGTRLLGTLPYRAQLVYPCIEQIAAEVHGRILCGEHGLRNHVEHTVIAAMAPQHVCAFLRDKSLVVTPGDRVDNILVAIAAYPSETGAPKPISGLLLTGGFKPPSSILALLEASGIPALLCNEDTYSVATHLQEMRFKIRPADTDKIEAATKLVHDSIDTPALLKVLQEAP